MADSHQRHGLSTRVARLRGLLARELVREAGAFRTHLRNSEVYAFVANPYATVWIDPSIVRTKLDTSHQSSPPGCILDGDWDLQVSDFHESPKYRGLLERFRERREWEDTTLFRETYRERIERKGVVLGMNSLDQVADYYRQHVDPLYESIRSHGFRSPSWRHQVAPAYIHIGRAGAIIWGTGGNHRLAMAKILRLDAIPVRVHIRHRHWQVIRDRLAAGDFPDDPSLFSHPDLKSLLQWHSGVFDHAR